MSLVSTDVAAPVTALDPILYDSGWKRVVGTGGTFDIEDLTYTVDSVVRVFGRMYKATQASEWRLYYDYQDNTNAYMDKWLELSRLDYTPRSSGSSFIAGVDYQIQIGSFAMDSDRPAVTGNASGYSLMAGKHAIFKCSGAQSSEGIEYRIVVERSTSAVMLSRSLGKSQ